MLELRPLLFDYKVVALQDVLAPINTKKLGYPAEANRDFGPWGLSFADDTWDLRRALVLETIAKEDVGTEVNNRQVLYVDLETLQQEQAEVKDRQTALRRCSGSSLKTAESQDR